MVYEQKTQKNFSVISAFIPSVSVTGFHHLYVWEYAQSVLGFSGLQDMCKYIIDEILNTNFEYASMAWTRHNIIFALKTKTLRLKGRIVQPPKTGLKCTSAAAPTLQQTVACQSSPLSQTCYWKMHRFTMLIFIRWITSKIMNKRSLQNWKHTQTYKQIDKQTTYNLE